MHTVGSYFEACGGGDGDIGTFSGLSVEQAQAACCENPLCAGFSYSNATGSGDYKVQRPPPPSPSRGAPVHPPTSAPSLATQGNAQCGVVQNGAYDGYTRPGQPLGNATGAAQDITISFADVNLVGNVSVYDIWAQAPLGVFQGSYTAKAVPLHGTAFLRLATV